MKLGRIALVCASLVLGTALVMPEDASARSRNRGWYGSGYRHGGYGHRHHHHRHGWSGHRHHHHRNYGYYSPYRSSYGYGYPGYYSNNYYSTPGYYWY